MNDTSSASTSLNQPQRWRSPLAIAAVAGLIFALLSGSVLLFFVLPPLTREYWVLVHWVLALVALVPYAVYQLRHYLRVRQYAQQTHYRVGLHAFFLVCGAIVSGVLLITPLERGTSAYSTVDLAHIFFGYAFTLLVSAHLTLVALLTMSRAPADQTGFAQASIKLLFTVASVVAVAVLGVAIAAA